MEFDFSNLDPQNLYKLISGVIVPRPIAWVNSLNPDGSCNTAPFSFFNAVAPGVVALGIGDRPDGTPKDTMANVRRHPEMVIHLPDEDTVEAMSFTSVDSPPGFEEATAAGLTLVPAVAVAVPRIAEAPVALEVKLTKEVELEPAGHHLLIGQVVHLYVRDDLLLDNFKINWRTYRPVGRLAGEGYAHVREFFALRRPTYARYLENPEAERSLRRPQQPA